VRDQLAKAMQEGSRERKYSQLADKLTNKTYAEPGSLEPAAQALGLKVRHTGLFTHKGTKDGIASNPKVVQAAFSDDVLAQGNNSGAIELGPNHMVVIHVNKHLPSKLQPLDQVSGKIRASILAVRVAKAAKAQADKLLAEVRKDGDLAKTVGPLGVAVQSLKDAQRRQKGVSQDLLDAAFRMPHPAKGKPDYASVDMGEAGYALVALDAVHPGDLSKVSKMERSFFRQRLTQANALAELDGFVEILRKHTKIEIAKQRM
jgi:peptidyl-prolyl cis-trans isomerase D